MGPLVDSATRVEHSFERSFSALVAVLVRSLDCYESNLYPHMNFETMDRERVSEKYRLSLGDYNTLYLFVVFLFLLIVMLNFILDLKLVKPIRRITPLQYRDKMKYNISLKIMQVSVLYFAVFVASFQFMDSSEYISYNNTVVAIISFALLSVSASATSSILYIMQIFDLALLFSLALMGLGFLLSFFTPVIAVLGDTAEDRAESQESMTTLERWDSKSAGPDHRHFINPRLSSDDETRETEAETGRE